MTWWGVFRSKYDNNNNAEKVLTNVNYRPKNDGTYFLIYSASNCVNFRDAAFEQLAKIDIVHYGGRCRGPTQNPNKTYYENKVSLRNWWDNVNTYKPFKFCLVMEHSNHVGYITEKILMAFLSGCIPIYYGSIRIYEFFNKESFIYYNISNPQLALQRIQYLHTNQTAYDEVFSHPILVDGAIEKFFSFSDDVGGGVLKHKIRHKLGIDQFEFV